jgi:hypothetical protein
MPLGKWCKGSLKRLPGFSNTLGLHPPSFSMRQMTFAVAVYAAKRKQTRKQLVLIERDRVVPW